MAEALVASAIQWIGSMLIQEGSALFEVADQVKGLQEELELMQQYLQDADAKQEMKEIQPLIKQIRKLVFDAEDLIDTYLIGVEVKAKKGWFKKVCYFLINAPQTYTIGRQIQLMESNVKRITERLVDIGIRKLTKMEEDLRLSSDQERVLKKKLQSYPFDDDDDYVVGLEKDIKKLVEVLMEEGKTQVNIISIVGMGGSGKTTLTRKLFNHRYTKECFDCCAWVYISQEWSTRHVLSEILRKVSSPKEMSRFDGRSSVEDLVDELRGILEKKSYLVVLDDVWRKDALKEILPALPRGQNNKGCKIIITTRNEEVVQLSNLQRHLYVHQPQPLNKEESWELFCKISSNYHIYCNDESYEELGKEMINKCDGLPLAIVALAGILNTKRSIREWRLVSQAVHSRIMEGSCTHMYGKVGDMLSLSYDDLPCHLKPCFLFLGVFPEDCQIPTGMLTRMWIAEGFVRASEDISLEDVALQHLEELSHRFMIQVVRTNFSGAIKVIQMHDLLRDICVRKGREQCFLQINTPTNNLLVRDASTTTIHSRRVSLYSSTCFPTEVSNVRSLVMLTKSSISHSAYASKEMVDFGKFHGKFKLLRMLNLWGIKTLTSTLPTEIGALIHLRYLGIRESNITELPQSFGNLKNLLTLDYRNVESSNSVKIFNSLSKLVVLRHLFLPIECSWNLEEVQLSALKNLQVLWGVKCEGAEWFARELTQLSTTLKKLKVVVSTEKNLEAAFSCPSLMSDHLNTFHCEWRDGLALKGINCNFSHNHNLHKMVFVGEIQVEKLCNLLPSNLLVLELKGSVLNKDPMIVVGALTHLKLLRLSNAYIGTQFTCNLGSFPHLEELYVENLAKLTTWKIEMGAMRNLKKFGILNCKKLQFSQGWEFLTALERFDFFGVSEEFAQLANAHGWSRERLRLPHNIDAIIEKSDTPVNISSLHKLHEQLTTGIYLNQTAKKFWVVKQGDQQYNCFMVYTAGLSLLAKKVTTWNEKERDGASIKVLRIEIPNGRLNVTGQFNIDDLSPGVTYTITCVIMIEDSKIIEKMHVNSQLHYNDKRTKDEYNSIDRPAMHEWFRIPIGEIESPETIGMASFFLQFECLRGPKVVGYRFNRIPIESLCIKGILIEPKLS